MPNKPELTELAQYLRASAESILSAIDNPTMNENTVAELTLISIGELAEAMGSFRHLTKGQQFAQQAKGVRNG